MHATVSWRFAERSSNKVGVWYWMLENNPCVTKEFGDMADFCILINPFTTFPGNDKCALGYNLARSASSSDPGTIL